MITEETKRKFEKIVRQMTPDQRAALQSRINMTPADQRNALVEKIVRLYEQEKGPVADKKASPASSAARPEKKIKKNLRNTLALILALVLTAGCALLIFRIYNNSGEALQEEDFKKEESLTEITEASATLTPTSTPTPSPSPEPTRIPVSSDHPDLTGLTIVIDPGHQEESDEEEELFASWLTTTKPRCTSGTTGVATGIPEYELTLRYALAAADYLDQCGADVILTRDTNDVNISNQERAGIALSNDADLFLRIHADAAGDSAASGVRVYYPDTGNYTDSSRLLAQDLADIIASAEGLDINRVQATSLYTGLNYANTVRSFQLSLGFLSNSSDEEIITDDENLQKVAQAISEFCAELI